MKIVVDAMGGDYAPQAVIAGVIEALKELKTDIVLIGRSADIQSELKKYHYDSARLDIIDAPEVVEMHEAPIASVRKKRNSSISLGVKLLKDKGYDAFISAGNTGAVVAASTIHLGMLPGVERPAIGVIIPTLKGFSFMTDMGANTEPKPEHLLQWALMARVYVKEVMDIANPSVGLLNIGEEEGKGTVFSKEAYKLMQDHLPSFIGNLEASEVYTGKSDIIICDGFVGNIVLKVSEGLAESVGKLIKREVKRSPLAMLGALLMSPTMKHIKKKADYSEYGGAPLLGVDGIVMISHGRSSPKAIKNAIRATQREIEHKVLPIMQEEIAKEKVGD